MPFGSMQQWMAGHLHGVCCTRLSGHIAYLRELQKNGLAWHWQVRGRPPPHGRGSGGTARRLLAVLGWHPATLHAYYLRLAAIGLTRQAPSTLCLLA